MKLAACAAVLLLSGCMSYGSWLEDVGKPPHPPRAMSNDQATSLAHEARRLRGAAQAIRVRLASETDRGQRMRLFEELRRIGDRLRPLESELRDAGRLA